MKRKELPKGIVRTSFHVLQEKTKGILDIEMAHLQSLLSWLDILYDDEKEKEGEMAFFIFSFVKRHPGLLSNELINDLDKKQIPIKECIFKSKKKQ